jgi:hypothetical protein
MLRLTPVCETGHGVLSGGFPLVVGLQGRRWGRTTQSAFRGARHAPGKGRERSYFGNFDPFGDFDLIFGAAKQNLKIVETPIHYKARTFGETQISRFRDGWLLLKMVWFAYRKLKAI